MSDPSRHASPQRDNVEVRHTLTVREVEVLFANAGVQRSHRHILRLCQTGMLDAVKVPGGPSGDEWYVAPASVPKAIGDLKQIEAQRARRAATQRAMTHAVAPPLRNDIGQDTASHVTLQPGMTVEADPDKRGETQPDAARHVTPGRGDSSAYIDQLEKRIEEKNRTIEFLQDELKDRRSQISGMKAIIDGQRQLLETINNNVAPVFGALAQLVQKTKPAADEPVHATIVDEPADRS